MRTPDSTAHGATQQTPNASARALKPTAPPVTLTILGFSLIGVIVDPVAATDSSGFLDDQFVRYSVRGILDGGGGKFRIPFAGIARFVSLRLI
jgi:hypothetical protein